MHQTPLAETIELIESELRNAEAFAHAGYTEKLAMLEKSETFQQQSFANKVTIRFKLVIQPEFRQFLISYRTVIKNHFDKVIKQIAAIKHYSDKVTKQVEEELGDAAAFAEQKFASKIATIRALQAYSQLRYKDKALVLFGLILQPSVKELRIIKMSRRLQWSGTTWTIIAVALLSTVWLGNWVLETDWTLRAAERGKASAQYEMGERHREIAFIRPSGRSSFQDHRCRELASAFSWYEKAARQGNADALFALAELHWSVALPSGGCGRWSYRPSFLEAQRLYSAAAAAYSTVDNSEGRRLANERLVEIIDQRALGESFLVGKCYRSPNVEETSPIDSCTREAIRRMPIGSGTVTIFTPDTQIFLIDDGANIPNQFRQQRRIETATTYQVRFMSRDHWGIAVVGNPKDEPDCEAGSLYHVSSARPHSAIKSALLVSGVCSEDIKSINEAQRRRGSLSVSLRSAP